MTCLPSSSLIVQISVVPGRHRDLALWGVLEGYVVEVTSREGAQLDVCIDRVSVVDGGRVRLDTHTWSDDLHGPDPDSPLTLWADDIAAVWWY